MIPIAKNVIVVDEFGNEYEPTYTKRAKGLVKHGRARFIAENRILLTRPPSVPSARASPYTNLEDSSVENNTYIPNAPITKIEEGRGSVETISVAEILTRIDKIIEDTSYLEEFFESWRTASSNNEGTLGIQQVIIARETTNQRIIEFLERIYDDIKPQASGEPQSMQAFRLFIEALAVQQLDDDTFAEVLTGGPGTGGGALKYFFGSESVFADKQRQRPIQNFAFNGSHSGFQPGFQNGFQQGFGQTQNRGRQGSKSSKKSVNFSGTGVNISEIVNDALRAAGLRSDYEHGHVDDDE